MLALKSRNPDGLCGLVSLSWWWCWMASYCMYIKPCPTDYQLELHCFWSYHFYKSPKEVCLVHTRPTPQHKHLPLSQGLLHNTHSTATWHILAQHALKSGHKSIWTYRSDNRNNNAQPRYHQHQQCQRKQIQKHLSHANVMSRKPSKQFQVVGIFWAGWVHAVQAFSCPQVLLMLRAPGARKCLDTNKTTVHTSLSVLEFLGCNRSSKRLQRLSSFRSMHSTGTHFRKIPQPKHFIFLWRKRWCTRCIQQQQCLMTKRSICTTRLYDVTAIPPKHMWWLTAWRQLTAPVRT